MPQRREERSKVNKQRRGLVGGVLAQLGAGGNAKEQCGLLVGERLSALRHQDFGTVEMNVLVYEAVKHKSNGGRRAHGNVHVLVKPPHAAEARASTGGICGMMSARLRGTIVRKTYRKAVAASPVASLASSSFVSLSAAPFTWQTRSSLAVHPLSSCASSSPNATYSHKSFRSPAASPPPSQASLAVDGSLPCP